MKRMSIGRSRHRRGARRAARSLIRELPNLFRLVFRLLRDPRVARVDKVLFGAVALYMLTPIDLIPDFLGVIGWVDDLYLLGLALGRLMGSAGPDALLRHWDGNPAALGYLVEGVEEIGGLLPANVRRGLRRVTKRPGTLRRRRGGRVKQIRIDEDARVRVQQE